MNIARVTPPRLRTRKHEGERKATWLELFYDLAFVVAVAVLSERLLEDVTITGAGSYVGYFTLLWWLWASHTYYADRYDTDDFVYRLLAAGQMAAVVFLAASLTGETDSTAAFAAAYLMARVLLLVMYWRAYRHVSETRELVKGYLIGFGVASGVWAAAVFAPEDTRFVLWAVALTVDLATPWLMRREQAKVPLDVSHLPERFGLFTILVLGESIAAVVAGLAHASWSVAPVGATVLGVGVATGAWWMYFDNARGEVVRRDASVEKTWRPTGWIYTHLPLAAALATLGVAMERAIEGAGHGPMHDADRWLLVCSVAVALGALAVIQLASTVDPGDGRSRRIVLNRVLGIPAVVLLGLLTKPASEWILLGVLGIVVAELVGDMALDSRHRRPGERQGGK